MASAKTREVAEPESAGQAAFERMLAAVLLEEAASALDNPTAVPRDLQFWVDRIRPKIEFAVKAQLTQSARQLLSGSGVTGPAIDQVLADVVPPAAEATYERVAVAARDIATKASSGLGKASVSYSAPSGPDPTVGAAREAADRAYQRIRVGSGLAAAEATTSMREGVRGDVALGLGATHKTWRTRNDARVRVTHGAMEGETRPIAEPFVTIEGDTLAYPGDPTAPIRSTANCRCRLSYTMPATPDAYRRGGKVVQIVPHDVASIQQGDRVEPVAAAANPEWDEEKYKRAQGGKFGEKPDEPKARLSPGQVVDTTPRGQAAVPDKEAYEQGLHRLRERVRPGVSGATGQERGLAGILDALDSAVKKAAKSRSASSGGSSGRSGRSSGSASRRGRTDNRKELTRHVTDVANRILKRALAAARDGDPNGARRQLVRAQELLGDYKAPWLSKRIGALVDALG